MHGRSHGTRRNHSSHLAQRIKPYDCTTTASLPLRQRTSLLPMGNSGSSSTLRSLRDTRRRFGLWLGLRLGTLSRRVRSIRMLGSGSKSGMKTKKVHGSALVLWKVTRRSAKGSRTRLLELFWQAAAETSRYGYGKVGTMWRINPLHGFLTCRS